MNELNMNRVNTNDNHEHEVEIDDMSVNGMTENEINTFDM